MAEEMIMVEFNGTRKSILKSKLPEARKMADDIKKRAVKMGYYKQEEAAQLFSLRIVKEEK